MRIPCKACGGSIQLLCCMIIFTDIAFSTESMTINTCITSSIDRSVQEGFHPGHCSYRDTYIPGSHDGEIFQHGWFVYTRAWQSALGKRWAVIVYIRGLATQDLGSCY